jgi:hypothetical protein
MLSALHFTRTALARPPEGEDLAQETSSTQLATAHDEPTVRWDLARPCSAVDALASLVTTDWNERVDRFSGFSVQGGISRIS